MQFKVFFQVRLGGVDCLVYYITINTRALFWIMTCVFFLILLLLFCKYDCLTVFFKILQYPSGRTSLGNLHCLNTCIKELFYTNQPIIWYGLYTHFDLKMVFATIIINSFQENFMVVNYMGFFYTKMVL